MNDLIEAIREFDGKHTLPLEQINAALPRSEGSLKQLLTLSTHDEAKIQVGATWLLKQWQDDDEPLIEQAGGTLVNALKATGHWEVQLHLLQILSQIQIPQKSLPSLYKLIQTLLLNDNKFVRAWTLSTLASVANQKDSYRNDAIALLQIAEQDDSAAVRARVRQLRKRFAWAKPK